MRRVDDVCLHDASRSARLGQHGASGSVQLQSRTSKVWRRFCALSVHGSVETCTLKRQLTNLALKMVPFFDVYRMLLPGLTEFYEMPWMSQSMKEMLRPT